MSSNIALASSILVRCRVEMDDPPGDQSHLLAAMKWLEARSDVNIVSVSLGSYDFGCEGDCVVSKAAESLAASGKHIVGAVGNIAGITACTAKSDSVLANAAVDPVTMGVAMRSGANPDVVALEPQVEWSWKPA